MPSIEGACHHASSCGTHTGWHATRHPAPHNSGCALLSPTTAGVPHACASTTGSPNPSPYDGFDKTSAAPITPATNPGGDRPVICGYVAQEYTHLPDPQGAGTGRLSTACRR